MGKGEENGGEKRSRKHQVWRKNNKLNFQNNGSRKGIDHHKKGRRERGRIQVMFLLFLFSA